MVSQMEKELQDLVPILNDDAPPVLYHYTSDRGFLGVVDSKTLWATHYRFMNDPKEFVAGRDKILGLLRAARADHAARSPEQGLLTFTLEKLEQIAPLDFPPPFLACFSEHEDSLSQWRAYGGHGTGYAIGMGFGVTDEDDAAQCFTAGLVRCQYGGQAYDDAVRSVIGSICHAFREYAETYIRDKTAGARALLAACRVLAHRLFGHMVRYKDPAYSEETEWRIMAFLKSDPGQNPTGFRIGANGLCPHIPIGFDPSSPTFQLKKVVVGPSPDQDVRALVAKLMLEKHGFGSCEVVKSRIPYRGPTQR